MMDEQPLGVISSSALVIGCGIALIANRLIRGVHPGTLYTRKIAQDHSLDGSFARQRGAP
ncbi:MAG: hypothetical protein AAGF88_04125 [Pseudomonadota bacterium]